MYYRNTHRVDHWFGQLLLVESSPPGQRWKMPERMPLKKFFRSRAPAEPWKWNPPDCSVTLNSSRCTGCRTAAFQGLRDRCRTPENSIGAGKFGMTGNLGNSPPILVNRARESIAGSRGDPPWDVGRPPNISVILNSVQDLKDRCRTPENSNGAGKFGMTENLGSSPPILVDRARESIAGSCSDPPWDVGRPPNISVILNSVQGLRDICRTPENSIGAGKFGMTGNPGSSPPMLVMRARESISGSSSDPPWDVGRPPNIYVTLNSVQGLKNRCRIPENSIGAGKFGMTGNLGSSPPILVNRARESIAGSRGDPPWDVGRPPNISVTLNSVQGLRERCRTPENSIGVSKFGMAENLGSSPPTMVNRARESIAGSRGHPPWDVGRYGYKTSSKAGTAMKNQVSGLCDEKKFSRRMQSIGFAHKLRAPSFSSLADPGWMVETMDLQCLRWMMKSKKQQKEKPMERLCSDYSHRE